jgi:photosystem II stability/assembly factor-like uncharacterized protein
MALAASSSEVLLAGTMTGGVLKSMTGGRSWVPSNAGLESMSVTSLAFAPDHSTIYAGTDAGIYRSDDAGTNWRRLSFPGKVAMAVAVDPSNPKVILAIEFVRSGDGRLYRSEDGGATWGRRE